MKKKTVKSNKKKVVDAWTEYASITGKGISKEKYDLYISFLRRNESLLETEMVHGSRKEPPIKFSIKTSVDSLSSFTYSQPKSYEIDIDNSSKFVFASKRVDELLKLCKKLKKLSRELSSFGYSAELVNKNKYT